MTPARRGLLAALLLSGLLVAVREVQYYDVAFDRFHLPAFDGHVYVAMAEHPGFFTVAPWGYRILNPWLVRLCTWPLRDHSVGFFWSTVLGLGLGGLLLFAYLKRLGHGTVAALLGLTLYGISPPVGEVVRYQFLAEPLAFLLEMALLLALEAGAPLGVLVLLGVLGALAKESFLFFLPLVWIVGREREGDRRALGRAAAVAAPALLLSVALRAYWTPQIHPPIPSLSLSTLSLAWERVARSWPDWRAATLLLGLSPCALVGAFRRAGHRLVPRGLFLALVAVVPPFLNPVTFFSDDIPRLLLYALPGIVPLALAAFDGWLPQGEAPPRAASGTGRLAFALAAVACLGPFFLLDRYRRIDLQGTRDATLMLSVFRGSLEAAEALESGDAFVFDSQKGRYSEPLPPRHNLSALRRVRWFLREGFPASAPRQGGVPTLAAAEGHLLLPCLALEDLEGVFTLRAPEGTRLALKVNGRPLADLLLGPGDRDFTVRIPGTTLFRGDNDLSLATVGAPAPVGLLRFAIRAR